MPLGFEIGFDRPWFLLLLVIIPVMWAFSFNSLAGLGRGRCILALAFRSLVVTLVVFAIADHDHTSRTLCLGPPPVQKKWQTPCRDALRPQELFTGRPGRQRPAAPRWRPCLLIFREGPFSPPLP